MDWNKWVSGILLNSKNPLIRDPGFRFPVPVFSRLRTENDEPERISDFREGSIHCRGKQTACLALIGCCRYAFSVTTQNNRGGENPKALRGIILGKMKSHTFGDSSI